MNQYFILRVCAIIFLVCFSKVESDEKNNSKVLSRRKRYVSFPEGSSFTWAYCMTAGTIMPFGIFTQGVNWGISYDLPNSTVFLDLKKSKKRLMQRRHRRDLYNQLELVMNSMGFNGKSCIYRTLCEVTRRFVPRKNSLMEEIIRIIFRFPVRGLSAEEDEHREYRAAYQQGRQNKQQDCSDMFPGCPFSLIDMALGYYSTHEDSLHSGSLSPSTS